MANLQDIIKIAKQDGGKFFVMDEMGETKLVIMDIGEYQKLLGQKTQTPAEDVEKVNQEITKAQLQESSQAAVPTPSITHNGHVPTNIPVLLNYTQAPKNNFQDLREEVIDPSFDYEAPKLDLDEI
jgi:hypothetical protein